MDEVTFNKLFNLRRITSVICKEDEAFNSVNHSTHQTSLTITGEEMNTYERGRKKGIVNIVYRSSCHRDDSDVYERIVRRVCHMMYISVKSNLPSMVQDAVRILRKGMKIEGIDR